eukprot:TRINITY_DN76949_c0_g1_i1.p1 TRINITY_DN76949_c0_g1~~TRINITY_DN76949_c0_g1_i1.p1  ORF type:complete len:445 (+),score=76.31 TRINITY_DN76949_c0_g1_i1:60-1394(+)
MHRGAASKAACQGRLCWALVFAALSTALCQRISLFSVFRYCGVQGGPGIASATATARLALTNPQIQSELSRPWGLLLSLFARRQCSSNIPTLAAFNELATAEPGTLSWTVPVLLLFSLLLVLGNAANPLQTTSESDFWNGIQNLFIGFPAVDPTLIEVTGEQVGDYKFLCLLGQGFGFGASSSVYKGVDQISNEEVAVKVVKKDEINGNVFAVSGIWNECKLLCRVQHPHVAKFRCFLQGSQCLYVVMSFAGKTNLSSLVEERSLLRNDIKTIFSQVACAVSHCHSVGLAHGDVKPANIVLDGSLRVQLVDFGQAVELHSTLETARRGTIQYAAPEVLSGKPYDPTAADCWSLGVVLLEMLCGADALPRLLGWQSAPRRGNEEDAAKYARDLESTFGGPGESSAAFHDFLNSQTAPNVIDSSLEAVVTGLLQLSPESRLTAQAC